MYVLHSFTCVLQDMEAEVNIHYKDLVNDRSREELLSNQLQRLLMCFDVYLETQCEVSGTEGPVEFAREKIFPRVCRCATLVLLLQLI